MHGATLGVVGMGNIGRQVARRARGFDMAVLYHNRQRNSQAEAELGVMYATLPELLRRADFVTLNVPVLATSVIRRHIPLACIDISGSSPRR